MKKTTFAVFLTLFGFYTYSQDSLRMDKNPLGGLIPFVEVGGHVENFSCNLEYVFLSKGKYSFGVWGGVGFNGFSNGWKNVQPESVLIGTTVFRGFKAHHLEFGLGLSYDWLFDAYNELVATPTVGYRYQTSKNNFFFRILASPSFKVASFSESDYQKDGTLRNSILGLGLGYYFPLNLH